ncbi:hypothetical protein LCGC14_0875260 [marine sediment metagenome]|uniref:Uncharacterized protein n=1 Tax=marine sediment metagenome TaxID=412755 RepID=A0A0F9P3K4_9ZZZZ|nr:hypothetical protein [archaeon]
MNSEKLIIHIVKDTGLSRGEIIEMIEQKKTSLRGKLSDALALFMIAKELAVNLELEKNRYLDDWI